jgi:two-component system chemotaxis response regulator CheY
VTYVCLSVQVGQHHDNFANERRAMAKKVLVADDSSTMRKIILRSLQAVGVPEAAEAGDGEEAVNMFKAGTYDLVLTDWNMPKKNGLDVIREIRAVNTTVPIIMVTTEAEKTRVLEAIQAGVSDYLVKPFTADMLREKLAKFE